MKKVNLACPVCAGIFADQVREDTVLECPHCGNSLYVSEINDKTAKLVGFNLALEDDEDGEDELEEFDEEEED